MALCHVRARPLVAALHAHACAFAVTSTTRSPSGLAHYLYARSLWAPTPRVVRWWLFQHHLRARCWKPPLTRVGAVSTAGSARLCASGSASPRFCASTARGRLPSLMRRCSRPCAPSFVRVNVRGIESSCFRAWLARTAMERRRCFLPVVSCMDALEYSSDVPKCF